MSDRIGLGMTVSEKDFIRRAAIAFRGIGLSDGEKALPDILRTIDRGVGLSEAQLLTLCRAVVRYRRSITDRMVVEFAKTRTKEY